MRTTPNQKYEQLSEDWRHRDQLTWQLPSVLVAVSGALITAVFQFEAKLGDVRLALLWAGVIFAALLTIALGQNLYYQTVTEDLIDAIENDDRVRADRIPKPRVDGPSFRAMLMHAFLKTGSAGLFVLSAGLTGFIGYLISDLHFQSQMKLAWGIGIGVFMVGLTIMINGIVYASHKQGENPSEQEKDYQ